MKNKTITVNPHEVSVSQFHGYLLSAVSPRPVAFVSTIDKDSNVNLSPFSFFNVFSANPPILIFSPARRGRDNTIKNTLENILEHPECTINVVSHAMTQQMSLSSTEYAKGINEFVKVGFTEAKSQQVKPPYVMESPVSFECKVKEVKPLGDQGGAGQLIICEALLMHIKENILDKNGKINPNKIDAIGRMGGDWYVRASEAAIFEVAKPLTNIGIGIDQLPDKIRTSTILTGNHLGMLGNRTSLPNEKEIEIFLNDPQVCTLLDSLIDKNSQLEYHKLAASLLNIGDVDMAWKILMCD